MAYEASHFRLSVDMAEVKRAWEPLRTHTFVPQYPYMTPKNGASSQDLIATWVEDVCEQSWSDDGPPPQALIDIRAAYRTDSALYRHGLSTPPNLTPEYQTHQVKPIKVGISKIATADSHVKTKAIGTSAPNANDKGPQESLQSSDGSDIHDSQFSVSWLEEEDVVQTTLDVPSNSDQIADPLADPTQPQAPQTDVDLLDPESWMGSMQEIESIVLARSYYRFMTKDMSDTARKESFSPQAQHYSGNSEVQQTFYQSYTLPQQRPLIIPSDTWERLVSIENELLDRWKESRHPIFGPLLRARNILLSLCATIHFLQEKYSASWSSFTILVEYPLTDDVYLIEYSIEDVLIEIQALNTHMWGLIHIPIFNFVRFNDESLRGGYDLLDRICDRRGAGVFWSARKWELFAISLDIAMISHFAAHVVRSQEHFSALDQFLVGTMPSPIDLGAYNLAFVPRYLQCFGEHLKDAAVYVLQTSNWQNSARLRVCSKIGALSEVWGPVWKVRAGLDEDIGYFYALGQGLIGQRPPGLEPEINGPRSPPEVIDCHFVLSKNATSQDIVPLVAPTDALLAIGAGLKSNKKCQTSASQKLLGLDIRPHGTSRSTYTSGPVTWSLSFQYSGLQIGAQKQMILRHGITRKEMLVNKWTLSPSERNPEVLRLWCGLEVSLCTRNARRVQLFHILRSEHTAKLFQSRLWKHEAAATAFSEALSQPDCSFLIALYNSRPEWREDIGSAIGSVLRSLSETGLQGNVFQIYHYAGNHGDDEQLVSLRPTQHSWTAVLNDSIYTATFAIVSHQCLSFPRETGPGQQCRSECHGQPQKSSLQTFIEAVPDTPPLDWHSQVCSGKYLPINDSRTQVLKVLGHTRHGELVVRLSTKSYLHAASMKLLLSADAYRFRECMNRESNAGKAGINVFVLSDKNNEFPTSKGKDRVVEGNELKPTATVLTKNEAYVDKTESVHAQYSGKTWQSAERGDCMATQLPVTHSSHLLHSDLNGSLTTETPKQHRPGTHAEHFQQC